MAITSVDISNALIQLGIGAGDIVLVHSSYKSLGPVEGGAAAVVAGFENVIGKEGTLVMPTLSMKDYFNSYKTWYMDKPSDTGYLTEFFRKQLYVYRSNQATHSVAARGKYAYELTFEHTAYGPHMNVAGEYAFADSSPWLKMYNMGTKTVFIGVSSRFNTIKHAMEGRYAEYVLSRVKDPKIREELKSQVATFGQFTGTEIWPMYSGQLMHDYIDSLGMIRHVKCGEAELLCMDMKETADAAYEELKAHPEKWCNEATIAWIKECQKYW